MLRSAYTPIPTLLAIILLLPMLLPSAYPLESSAQLATHADQADRVGRLAQGVYRVFATREGLVGGWTTSNHQIVENDFFIALPACTPANCPEGAPRGTMTDCGDSCYVKVINPGNNQCRVEPIRDTGPWFTVDDWWNPEKTRYLNTLPSTSPRLPQGLPAAEAARDGQDVGFGVSPDGIGFDNTHQLYDRPRREVGNRSAIDLADGTWWNLELVAEDTIGTYVVVHMLWQTGEDPYAAATGCGHKLNTPGDVPPSASPVASPVAAAPANRPAKSGSFSCHDPVDWQRQKARKTTHSPALSTNPAAGTITVI